MHERLSRRTLLTMAAASAVAAVLAACGGTTPAGTASGPTAAPAGTTGGSTTAASAPTASAATVGAPVGSKAAPSGRQDLNVGAALDQYVLEGPRASLSAYPVNANVVETLTYLTANYEVQPLLAERWEFRPPNTWRFFLRKGVTFHDGQPLTAKAVKEGLFDRVAKIPGGSTIQSTPEGSVVVDDYTIDFTSKTTNLRVPEQIVHPNNSVYAPGSDAGKKPVGTGPFRFVEYLTKERIVVERNDNYWGEKAKLARLTFRFYPDANTRRLALESGDIDVAYDVSRPDVKALKDKGFTIVNSPVGAYEAMYANIHGKPGFDLLAELPIRQAISYSVDRDKLVAGVLDGLATTDQTFVPPAILGSNAGVIKGYPYDPTKAKALLDAAGWKPGAGGIREKAGRRLKLVLISGFPSAEAHRPIPTYLQSQLKEIGIELEVQERPDSASFQALLDSGDGDLYLEQGSQNDANPGFLPVLLFYTGGTGEVASYQKLFAPGAKFDQLLAPSLTEVDMAKVKASVAAAMSEAIDQQVSVIPLAGIYRIYGLRKSVAGFVPHPASLHIRWDGVTV